MTQAAPTLRRYSRLARCARAIITGARIGGAHCVGVARQVIPPTVQLSTARYGAATLVFAEDADSARAGIDQVVDGDGALYRELLAAGIPERKLAHPSRLSPPPNGWTPDRRHLHSAAWRWN